MSLCLRCVVNMTSGRDDVMRFSLKISILCNKVDTEIFRLRLLTDKDFLVVITSFLLNVLFTHTAVMPVLFSTDITR